MYYESLIRQFPLAKWTQCISDGDGDEKLKMHSMLPHTHLIWTFVARAIVMNGAQIALKLPFSGIFIYYVNDFCYSVRIFN